MSTGRDRSLTLQIGSLAAPSPPDWSRRTISSTKPSKDEQEEFPVLQLPLQLQRQQGLNSDIDDVICLP